MAFTKVIRSDVLLPQLLLTMRSERCLSHRLPRLPTLGVQTRRWQLQTRRSRWSARDQAEGFETCTHPSGLFLQRFKDAHTSPTKQHHGDRAGSGGGKTEHAGMEHERRLLTSRAERGQLFCSDDQMPDSARRSESVPSMESGALITHSYPRA